MIKKNPTHPHIFSLFKTRIRSLTTCPLPLDPPTTHSISTVPSDHKSLCFSLAEQLIQRGFLSSAQQVIQRIISQSLNATDAISVMDFAILRGMELDLSSYHTLFEKLVGSGETQKAEDLYMDRFIRKGINPDPCLLGCMLICYCKLGKLKEEKSHFERLIKGSSNYSVYCKDTCTDFLRELFAQERVLDAFHYFIRINDAGIFLGVLSYNMLIGGLSLRGYLGEALSMFDIMLERGLPPVAHLWKSLVFGFCKSGRVEDAELLSAKMELSGVSLDKIMYTALINGYCKNKKMKMAMRVFLKMLKMGCDPDIYTYNTLIHGFFNLGLFDKGRFLHDHMIKSGLEPNLVTYQVMISKYCKEHKVDYALRLLNSMSDNNITPSVHCYTPIISTLHKEKRLMVVDELYKKMHDTGVVPDHVLFFSLIKCYPKGHELDLALRILRTIAEYGCGIDLPFFSSSAPSMSTRDVELEIHHLLGKIVESGPDLANMAISIYIVGLCMGGKTDDALLYAAKLVTHGFEPLLSAYNSLIKCLCEEGLVEHAKSVIELMEDAGLVPNSATFLVMVDAHCKRGDLASASDVLHQMEERGVKPSVAIYDSIIGCLGREKRIFDAHTLFNRMLKAGVYPDEFFYVTMINAYSKNRRTIEANKLFDLMVESGMRPSSYAYSALINGLIKKNMVTKGCHYLVSMLEDGFEPNNVMYTSLINQFLRKGKLEFALRLFALMESSQIECDHITYITLVSGVCRNIQCNKGRRHDAHKKSKREKEMLFNLLRQKALVQKDDFRESFKSKKKRESFALKLIGEVKDTSFMPSLYLYNGIISGFCRMGRFEDANHHLGMMQREGVGPNQVTFTILIDGHIQFGEIDPAVELFNWMNADGCSPDRILYNILIKGLCRAGPERLCEALSLSHTMRKRGFSPSKVAYNTILGCLCDNRWSNGALRICEEMISDNYLPSQNNSKQLISLLHEENKSNEARMVQSMILEKR